MTNLRYVFLTALVVITTLNTPCLAKSIRQSLIVDLIDGDGKVSTLSTRFLSTTNTTDSSSSKASKPWGSALFAAFLVNVVSLIGVVFIFFSAVAVGVRSRKGVPTDDVVANGTAPKANDFYSLVNIYLPAFAAGALLPTSLFLIIPEALELIAEGNTKESQTAWKFGASVLGGYMLPLFLGSFFSHFQHSTEMDQSHHDAKLGCAPVKDEADSAVEKVEDGTLCSRDEKDKKPARRIDFRLASSILIGDFFHNFADGIFIGNAFLLCNNSVAIVVTAGTVFHELAQELSDFCLLTNQCAIPTVTALIVNFISGLSVMFGVIVILAIEVPPASTGALLAISSGVYIFIAAAECQPRIENAVRHFNDRMLSMLCFVMGCVPIGLVLLKHVHCEA